MTYNEESLFSIPIEYYKAITKCDKNFAHTEAFDRSCGICYVTADKHKIEENILCFYFTVVDEKKYLLAKLKYNI